MQKRRNNMIIVVSAHDCIYLVIDGRQAYLVNYDLVIDEFGYLCPCCLSKLVIEYIQAALERAVEEGLIDGKILWCSHKTYTPHFGEMVGKFSSLNQEFFAGGSAENISPETRVLLREEAQRWYPR